jgi:DNA-binding CsgD family transcriptional regulator
MSQSVKMNPDPNFLDFLKTEAHRLDLSKAEWEALFLAAGGDDISAIAQKLEIKVSAVRQRLSQVYQKFEVEGQGPVKFHNLQKLLQSRYQQWQLANPAADDSNSKQLTTPPHKDWGDAPDVSVFYGRREELATLKGWVVEEKCRLVALVGMGGIGKTSLAAKLAGEVEGEFDRFIWRSLRHNPPIGELLDELLLFFSDSQPETLPPEVEKKISLLVKLFSTSRYLVILDNVETILRSNDLYGRYREGCEGYGILWRRIGEIPHQSCCILTTQERLREVAVLSSSQQPVRELEIKGLKPEDAKQILREKGLQGESRWETLIEIYRGNPLGLKTVAKTIQEIFNNNVNEFVKWTTTVMDDLWFQSLDKQFDRLSENEKLIVKYLAKTSKPVKLKQLKEDVFPDVSSSIPIQGLESIVARSLVDNNKEGFLLHPMVEKYVNERFN